jgi:hypothetical protein
MVERRSFEMNRFKKYISAAIGTMFIVMAFLAAGAAETQAGPKTRKGKSTLRSCGTKSVSGTNVSANQHASGSRRRTNRVTVATGDVNNDNITSRKSSILPYMEQDNVYNLRRP